MVIFWLFVAVVPIGISVGALLDAARRPARAWSLAMKSQVGWIAAIAFGVFLLIFGIAISLWYLVFVRPAVAAVEAGNLAALEPTADD